MEILRLRWHLVLLRLITPGAMALLIGLSSIIFAYQATAADDFLEYKVKAAFLYKFSAYVDWPTTAFNSPTSPFSVCLLDSSDLFNTTLEKVVNGESVNAHPVVVRRITAIENEVGCHILYVGTYNSQRNPQAIKSDRDSFALTVSDSSSHGVINFLIADNHVRFNIDDEAAAQKHLVISSKLLSLAVNVKRRIPREE